MRSIVIHSPGRKWPAILSGIIILLGFLFGGISSHGQSVSLGWNPAPSGTAAGYALYIGATSGDYSTRIDVGDNTVATLTGLVAGQTYYFVVTAYNSARVEGPPSNVASFVVPTQNSSLAPQLAAVSPASAPPGAQVFVYGANFTSATSVQFAGVSAPFSVSSDGLLIVTVPAATGGPLTIITANGVISTSFAVLPATAPANDNFSSAQLLTGTPAVAFTNTMGATKQAGEPNHAGNSGGHSVWYRWTAPTSGIWTLDTTGSAFTTLLAVYTGNTLTSLSTVASNLTAADSLTNALTFTAAAGVTYQIAVDGFNGAAGNLVLHLAPAPVASTVYATSFETTDGFLPALPLAGQAGWLVQGSAPSGIKFNLFPGLEQQGYIGFLSSVPASSTLVYYPLNYTVNTNTSPLINFSVLMQIANPVASPYDDVFGWVVRNASGLELFRISFDDNTKAITYTLNNGAGPVFTGFSVNNTVIYNLAISMDFAHNLWSATLNGAALVTGQPISASGAALTLGDIDASENFKSPSLAGTDGMAFDNYLVTASPGLAPAILQGPQSQTVTAGNGAFLGAMVSGAAPLSFQWYCNNTAIANATNSSLLLAGLTASQTGSYSLVAANGYGTTSVAATLTVTNPPPKSRFTAPVALGASGALLNLSVAAGNSYSFQVSTNLKNWVTLGTFVAMSTNALCFDSAATKAGSRFYRLVSP